MTSSHFTFGVITSIGNYTEPLSCGSMTNARIACMFKRYTRALGLMLRWQTIQGRVDQVLARYTLNDINESAPWLLVTQGREGIWNINGQMHFRQRETNGEWMSVDLFPVEWFCHRRLTKDTKASHYCREPARKRLRRSSWQTFS